MYSQNLMGCRQELTELSKNKSLTDPTLIAKTRDIEEAWIQLNKLRKTLEARAEHGESLSGNEIVENARQLESLLFSFSDLYRYDDSQELIELLGA
jgi:hypothetical protein